MIMIKNVLNKHLCWRGSAGVYNKKNTIYTILLKKIKKELYPLV